MIIINFVRWKKKDKSTWIIMDGESTKDSSSESLVYYGPCIKYNRFEIMDI